MAAASASAASKWRGLASFIGVNVERNTAWHGGRNNDGEPRAAFQLGVSWSSRVILFLMAEAIARPRYMAGAFEAVRPALLKAIAA